MRVRPSVRDRVLAYRDARALEQETRKIARETETNGHATEGAEWDAEHGPGLTFKAWLKDHRTERNR